MIDEKVFTDEDKEQDALSTIVDLAAYLSVTAHDEDTRAAATRSRQEAYRAIDEALAKIDRLSRVLDHFPQVAPLMRSPVSLMGGKHYLAERIVAAFPHDSAYDTYIEPFCGSCSVLFRRRPGRHCEIVSDLNSNLVNFMLQLRDNRQALADCLDSLPYSRELYYSYHHSLFDGTELDSFARAARWFYVMRSSIIPSMRRSPVGWASSITTRRSEARAYHSAIALFGVPVAIGQKPTLSLQD